MVVKSDEDVDGYGDGYGDGDRRNPPSRLYNLPSPFPPNLSLVLRLPASYLIFSKAIIVLDKVIPYSIKSNPALVLIIVLDKVVISSIPPNPPYYITIILIVSSDKDISPNTIIAPDKASALILIIILDRATLQLLL